MLLVLTVLQLMINCSVFYASYCKSDVLRKKGKGEGENMSGCHGLGRRELIVKSILIMKTQQLAGLISPTQKNYLKYINNT